jgi:hypothetical protein
MDRLYVVAGTAAGGAAMFRLLPPASGSMTCRVKLHGIMQKASGGHTEVRAVRHCVSLGLVVDIVWNEWRHIVGYCRSGRVLRHQDRRCLPKNDERGTPSQQFGPGLGFRVLLVESHALF